TVPPLEISSERLSDDFVFLSSLFAGRREPRKECIKLPLGEPGMLAHTSTFLDSKRPSERPSRIRLAAPSFTDNVDNPQSVQCELSYLPGERRFSSINAQPGRRRGHPAPARSRRS